MRDHFDWVDPSPTQSTYGVPFTVFVRDTLARIERFLHRDEAKRFASRIRRALTLFS